MDNLKIIAVHIKLKGLLAVGGKHAAMGLLFFLVIAVSCSGGYVPKPRAYYRIPLPDKEYQALASDCPYGFEYPSYATTRPDMEGDEQYCWMNLDFADLNATLHLSYKPIMEEGDFQHLVNDAYTFVEKHNIKAERIEEQRIANGDGTAGGLIFRIGGNTASNLQFFLTDSSRHFLRGSLYFNCQPNKDSLSPVVSFLAQDIDHLVSSLKWNDNILTEYR